MSSISSRPTDHARTTVGAQDGERAFADLLGTATISLLTLG
ncbi:MAG TPA: hypothetical protein VMH41_09930 [Mycobacteriales bacterium]|nr:hypothetical protein [Mycobacteriales bacterium]